MFPRACLAILDVNAESHVKFEPVPVKPEVVEGGTRLFPVRVINSAGDTHPNMELTPHYSGFMLDKQLFNRFRFQRAARNPSAWFKGPWISLRAGHSHHDASTHSISLLRCSSHRLRGRWRHHCEGL